MTIPIARLLRHLSVPILPVVQLLMAGIASGQEAVVPLQFSFSDPGARSMGFGGAFVALADDATAALANPAGLVQLLRPEVSIEARHRSHSTPYTEGGRVEGLPSGFGIDTLAGLRTASSHVEHTALSFLSLVYPGDDWSLSLFRHELADFEFVGETQGLFGGGSSCCQIRNFDQRWASELEIESYGISGAYRVSDRFDIGLGVLYYDTSFLSNATVFAPDDDSVESLFATTSYLPERSVLAEKLSTDDTDWALAGGFLWRLSESWSVGGVYRQAPEFDFRIELTAGEAAAPDARPGDVLLLASAMLELPEVYGLGMAYRAPGGSLIVTFQWDRVNYANIVDSLSLDDRALDDADEFHLGAEYVFLRTTPVIAVRLGTWLEPDNQLRAKTDEPFARALLPGGDDELHYAAGLGVAMQRFQVDLGMDFSDRVDTVSLSAIYTF